MTPPTPQQPTEASPSAAAMFTSHVESAPGDAIHVERLELTEETKAALVTGVNSLPPAFVDQAIVDPSHDALEAARRWYWNGDIRGGLGRDTDEAERADPPMRAKIRSIALALDAFARAHFAREFARRVEEAERVTESGVYRDALRHHVWLEGRAAAFAALRALGGEGGKHG
jgi:hypothetical protein